MKQNYFKTLLVTLLAMICGDMIAQSTETIDLTAKGYGNGDAVSLVTGENVKLLFSKGTGSNAPAYYDTGTAVRLYGGGTLTISSSTKTIKSITFTFHSSYAPTSSNCSVTSGTYDVSTKTWTGEATEIVMKNTASSGHFRFQKLVVTFMDSSSGQGTEDPQNSFTYADEYATVGEDYTIQELNTLNITGARRYGSSDETVAKVDGNGNVTLYKSGETTITVTTLANDTYREGSASYLLHVAKGTAELSFAQSTVTAIVGTNQNGPELTNPRGIAVTYKISDSEIATIEQTGYIKPLKAGQATVTVTPADPDAWEATASYTLEVKAAFSVDAVGTYELVTDASTLADGDQILISYIPENGAYVLGAKQSNNFKATLLDTPDLSEDKRTFEITSTFLNSNVVTAAVLEGSAEAWYFHVNDGYLCATSSSSNNLGVKTLNAAGDDAKATIGIENGNASIIFQGDNERNNLRYNPNKGSSSGPLFSCYASTSNTLLPQLYRKIILPKVPISFAESVVEITYGDNYNKQAATTEGYSGSLVYTSSDESVVKFHGNNVIDILGHGTVTITATAPATDTTEESSATYTLKVYEPADAVEGQTELLNETFDDCAGDEPKEGFGGNSSGFTGIPSSLTDAGWVFNYCQAGKGYLKVSSTNNTGIVTTPELDLNGQSTFSFEIAPWVGETANVTIYLENATFEDGTTTSKTFNDLEQSTWKTKTFDIIGNGNVKIMIAATRRVFIDNFVVGGGAQPAHEINLTFSSAGYLTWVATADIDFSQTPGVTAYQITEATTQKITAEEVDKVPTGAAVMLKGSGTVQLKRTSDVAALANNKMLACTDGSVVGITGNQTTTDIYVLGNGSNGLGYYMLKNTLQAGKGYLNISGGASAKVTFVAFEETVPTGISSVSADSADGVYYNLQGVRVLNPQKGIYIKDGKKIVIK